MKSLPADRRPPEPTDAVDRRAASTALPLLLWTAIQAVPLSLAVFRIPLSGNYPAASERLAIDLLLAVQIGGSAILFPWLLRNARLAIAVIAAAWPPLAAAAALLSSVEFRPALQVGGFVSLWLAGLAFWNRALPWGRARSWAIGIFGLWAIGGVLLVYLRAEFASVAGQPSPSMSLLLSGPIAMAWELTIQTPRTLSIWAAGSFHAIAGGLVAWATVKVRREHRLVAISNSQGNGLQIPPTLPH